MSGEYIHLKRHGVSVVSEPPFDVVLLAGELSWGRSILIRGAKQQVEIRITPRGLLRVGKRQRSGGLRASGIEVPNAHE